MTTTVLGDFARSIRDEPFFYIYKHKIWVMQDTVPASEVVAWLRQRYVERPRGHRYRVITYGHSDAKRYVDYLLMESCDNTDLVYLRLHWGWSKTAVARGERVKRRRLTPRQKAELDSLIRRTRDAYYASMD